MDAITSLAAGTVVFGLAVAWVGVLRARPAGPVDGADYLRTLETVEENIALVTGSRERTTKRLLDGERGVSFAKQLLTPIIRPR